MKKTTIALFDFDGTLTKGLPSRLLFFKHLVGFWRLIGSILQALPAYLYKKFAAKIKDPDDFLDKLFLVGWSKEELEHQAEVFVDRHLVNKMNDKAVKCLKFHQSQGHICIIVSGGFEIYLNILAKKYNIQYVIGSQIEFDHHNKSTGHILNGYCLGNEKVVRINTLLSQRSDFIVYAYGDSSNDKALLDYADYGYYRRFE